MSEKPKYTSNYWLAKAFTDGWRTIEQDEEDYRAYLVRVEQIKNQEKSNE